MGKIPEYDRRQLASSYVGGAQMDNTGALAVQEVNEAIQPTLKNELQKQAEITDFQLEQNASNILADASLKFQERMIDAQKSHADNPEAYPNAVQDILMKLSDEYSKGIGNDRVKQKVMAGFGQMRRSVIPSTVVWSVGQREEITKQALRDTIETSIAASSKANTVDDLNLNLQAIYDSYFPDTTGLPKAEIAKILRISPDEARKLWDTDSERAINAFLYNQVQTNPELLVSKLNDKNFRTFTVDKGDGTTLTLSINAETATKYKKAAQDYAIRKVADRDNARILESTGEDLSYNMSYLQGEVGIRDLYVKYDVMERDPDTPKESLENMAALIRVAARRTEDSAKLDDLVKGKLYSDFAALANVMDKKKNGKSRFDKHPVDYTTDLLKLQTRAWDAVDKGEITLKDAQQFLTKLAIPLYRSMAVQKGQGWWPADPNAAAYKDIDAKIMSISTLATSDKAYAKAKTFSRYMDLVSAAEDKGVAINKDKQLEFAREAFFDTVKVYFPEVAASMTKEPANALASETAGVTLTHNVPTNLKATKTLKNQNIVVGKTTKMINGAEYIAGENGWERIKK